MYSCQKKFNNYRISQNSAKTKQSKVIIFVFSYYILCRFKPFLPVKIGSMKVKLYSQLFLITIALFEEISYY